MKPRQQLRILGALSALIVLPCWLTAHAAELQDLKGFDDIFGRYAPGGDCKRQPQVLVDATGMTFVVAGQSDKVTNPESVWNYSGPDYKGPDRWFFPFRIKDGYSVLMTFHAGGKIGTLTIDAQDEGYPGGPPLSPRNKALVTGSPYLQCK